MTYPRVPLSKITSKLESGSRPSGGVSSAGDIFSIGGEHLNDFGGFNFSKRKLVSQEFFQSMKRGIVKPKDILIVKDGATTGKTSFVGADFKNFPSSINEHVFRLEVNSSKAHPPYVFFYLFSPQGNREILSDFRGATIGGISQDFINKVFIPLPSLPEQKRIAAQLAQADRLRQLRRNASQLGESYLQSAFLMMFGDPARNPKNWPIKPLRELSIKFSDGPFGSNLKSAHYTESGVRVIRLQNVGIGELVDKDKAFISEEHFNSLKKHTCLPGDVIAGTMGDPNLRAMILPSSISLALNKADCVQIRPNPKIANAQYISWLLNMPGTLHLAKASLHGQTRTRISMGQLAILEIPLPPLSEQKRFAQIVARYEKLRSQMRESTRQAELLFQGLLHESFGQN